MVLLFAGHQPYVNQIGFLFGVGFSARFIAGKRYPDNIIFDHFGGLHPRRVKRPRILFIISLACFLKTIDFLWQNGNGGLLICQACGLYQLETNGTAGLTHFEADWNGRGKSDHCTRLLNLLHQIVCFGRDGLGLHCTIFWEFADDEEG